MQLFRPWHAPTEAGRLPRIGAAGLAAWVLVLAGGCASTPSSSLKEQPGLPPGAGPGGSLWERLEANRGRTPTRADLDRGVPDLPPGWKRDIDHWWSLWLQDDAAWPEARTQWKALGPTAVNILAENLIRAYVLAADLGDGPLYYRARDEIAQLREAAVPYLVEGLAQGRGDSVVRNRCGDLLAYLGDGCVPAVVAAYPEAAWEGRWALVRVLKNMRSPGSVPFLIEVAGSADPFQVRIEAIEALGRMGAREAAPCLQECLRDSDLSVRKFAATYLGVLGDRSRPSLDALVTCLEEARRAGEGEVARACALSLRRLTGVDRGTDTEGWRALLRNATFPDGQGHEGRP